MLAPMSISRRGLLAGGIAATALGLSACGSNTGRPSGGGGSGSSGGKPTLSQWYHEYGEAGVEDAVKRYAASYPKATIEVKWKPGNYEQAVGAALLTQNIPDEFEYANGPTLDMIKAGQVVDLTDALGDKKDEFNQAIMEPRIWEDKIYGIPQTIDMQMLYYRKSILQQAGVQPPTTFAALVDAAKSVATKDMGGFFAGNDSGLGVLGQMFIWSCGFDMLNDDKSGIGFDDPAFAQALTDYKAFRDDGKGALLQSASADWSEPAAFINGETAMQWTGLWVLPEVQKELGDDFGVIPFPAIGSAGKASVAAGAFSACVAAKGTDPDLAKDFATWLWVGQEDYQVDFSTSYGMHIPAKPALAARSDKLASGPGKDAATMVADSGKVPDLLWTPAISTAFGTMVGNVILKGENAQQQLSKLAATAKSELARAKKS